MTSAMVCGKICRLAIKDSLLITKIGPRGDIYKYKDVQQVSQIVGEKGNPG